MRNLIFKKKLIIHSIVMSFLNNKKILFFGPANNFDENTDFSYFNNYDYIFINNKFIELIQPNLQKIAEKKFGIILLLNGIFTEGNPETIKKYDDSVFLYLVSETCLMHNLINIGIVPRKIASMANNYRKFDFYGCPNMFPKLLMLFTDHHIKVSEFKITGITFYLDLINGFNSTESVDPSTQETYHKNYHNWDTKIPKELSHLSDDEKMDYHLKKIIKNGTGKVEPSQKHYIKENFNFFLKYYNSNKDNTKFEFDDKLKGYIESHDILFT